MSDETPKEPRTKILYTGDDKRVQAVTVNGEKYPLDPETREASLPAGAAHALVVGEPSVFRYVSERKQERVDEQLAEAEGRDNAPVLLDTSTPRPAEPAGLPTYPTPKKR